jgi:hypothetical protein
MRPRPNKTFAVDRKKKRPLKSDVHLKIYTIKVGNIDFA